MEQEILFSLCIPTCNRVAIIKQMLNSLLEQNVDESLFEICISDNSPTDETKNLIESEFCNVKNLRYKKVTCKGFLNSIEALKLGRGKFLKLHNDYSLFNKDALSKMLNVVKKYETERAALFFSVGVLKNKHSITEFNNFNDFMKNINIYSTWSTSFAIWKEDFDKLMLNNVEVNYMYPHTTLLFRIFDKNCYVVDNENYVTNIEPAKKGGYNLVDNFVRIYLNMVKDDLLNNRLITKETYSIIQKNIIKFCASWYQLVKLNKDKYTFTFDNDTKIVRDTCGTFAVQKYKLYKLYYAAKSCLKRSK